MELDKSRVYRLFLADCDSAQGFVPAEKLAPYLASTPAEAACAAADLPEGMARAVFAAVELSGALNRVLDSPVEAGRGDETDGYGFLMLDCPLGDRAGTSGAASQQTQGTSRFAWRASTGRVELHGDSPAALLAAVYDFLSSLGFFWISPGKTGWRCPSQLKFSILKNSSSVPNNSNNGDGAPAIESTLILGQREYVEAAEDYILFAVRNGYRGIFFHTTSGRIAYGAAPASLYEKMRPAIVPLLRVAGLDVELGGHGLSGLLPRRLFRQNPELFRMVQGKRSPDHNFCVSNPETLSIAVGNFLAFVRAHPEVRVFHFWPDDLPGGGWCSCARCAHIPAGRQALIAAKALAEALEKERPDARLSFLAYHDTEDLSPAAEAPDETGETPFTQNRTASIDSEAEELPKTLSLLWAPRRRSWAKGYGDESSRLNSSSRAHYESTAAFFAEQPKSVFEYYEDAILFKAAVPPLVETMAGDRAYYAGLPAKLRPFSIGVLATGPGLPIAPRPNIWLCPRIMAGPPKATAAAGTELPQAGLFQNAASQPAAQDRQTGPALYSARLFSLWQTAAYGAAAKPMGAYWAALSAACQIDLDIDEGDTEVFMPDPLSRLVTEPPADWGDPWKADAARLSSRRARSDELFAKLREAEKNLEKARKDAAEAVPDPKSGPAGAAFEQDIQVQTALVALRAVHAEELSYNLDSAIIELNSARTAAYYEAAQGAGASAGDIAFIALTIAASAKRAGLAMPSAASRDNLRFLILFNYELRLRQLARYKFGPVHRALSIAGTFARCLFSSLRMISRSRV